MDLKRIAARVAGRSNVTEYTRDSGYGTFFVVFSSPSGNAVYEVDVSTPEEMRWLESTAASWQADPTWGGNAEVYDSESAAGHFGVSDPGDIVKDAEGLGFETAGTATMDEIRSFFSGSVDPWTGSPPEE